MLGLFGNKSFVRIFLCSHDIFISIMTKYKLFYRKYPQNILISNIHSQTSTNWFISKWYIYRMTKIVETKKYQNELKLLSINCNLQVKQQKNEKRKCEISEIFVNSASYLQTQRINVLSINYNHDLFDFVSLLRTNNHSWKNHFSKIHKIRID